MLEWVGVVDRVLDIVFECVGVVDKVFECVGVVLRVLDMVLL